ncbi:hypothetical protein F5H01DRAFT_330512 [Linnemannia elongata]|nr:hypothetical protein F5H01DRAFT_330512 [Linnemannia elongata]
MFARFFQPNHLMLVRALSFLPFLFLSLSLFFPILAIFNHPSHSLSSKQQQRAVQHFLLPHTLPHTHRPSPYRQHNIKKTDAPSRHHSGARPGVPLCPQEPAALHHLRHSEFARSRSYRLLHRPRHQQRLCHLGRHPTGVQ